MGYNILTECQFIQVHPDAKLPERADDGAAGFDLSCVEGFVLHPGEQEMVSTGLKISLPDGFEAQVRPRSGLAAKHGVTVLNSPGTIDPSYTGMCNVILINHGKLPVAFKAGDRIAQLVFAAVSVLPVKFVTEFTKSTERGEGGFGSTGR